VSLETVLIPQNIPRPLTVSIASLNMRFIIAVGPCGVRAVGGRFHPLVDCVVKEGVVSNVDGWGVPQPSGLWLLLLTHSFHSCSSPCPHTIGGPHIPPLS
jgi:hypothetical protein